MNKAILSTKYPQFAEQLHMLGYDIIPSETIPCEMPYERDHADLQCLILDDTAFVLNSCQQLNKALSANYYVISCGEEFGGKYPENVGLNAAGLGNKLLCRVPSLDSQVKDYCKKRGYELINVNQGYAKCSCAVVSDNAIITADQGIIRALQLSSIEVLPIGKGSVSLCGAEYGFIGGASGYDKDRNMLYFCGNINKHPDYQKIKDFCDTHRTTIFSLTDNDLTDIGGIVFY